MTKQEQIEEIKRDIKKALEVDCSRYKCKTCKHKNEDNCEIPLITDYLIEQGYQKLPKDSVVLTKEEYEMLANQYKNLEIKYSNLCDNYRLCKDANETLKQNIIITRKETAEKILNEVLQEIFYYFDVQSVKELNEKSLLASTMTFDVVTDKIFEIATREAVEIKE